MLYLSNGIVKKLQPSWDDAIRLIENAVLTWSAGHFSQPIKPYLRYGNKDNRIIAMPAYLGGSFEISGLKWIASFPGNLEKNLPRAHSVTILNDAETGKPLAFLNSSLVSGIRTAAVSGLILKAFLDAFQISKLKIGIIGFGPIGQLHLEMISALFDPLISTIYLFDIASKAKLNDTENQPKIERVSSWQEAYDQSDIFITCTTSQMPYINRRPKIGSLHLNVSLRDYNPDIIYGCPHLVVDDWEEVCRENTDIERAHKKHGLQKEQTHSIIDIIKHDYFNGIDKKHFLETQYCIFNPMGMALFDIAFAKYYYQTAKKTKQGSLLDE